MTASPPSSPAPTAAIQLTAPGTGAIAVILLTGPHALSLLTKLTTSPKLPRLAPGQFARATLSTSSTSPPASPPAPAQILDDALIVRIADSAYELHLHGGIAVVSATLAALTYAGATVLTPAQAANAGLLGDPLQSDLQLTLPQATTATALHLLAQQTTTGLAQWMRFWQNFLQNHPSPTALWQLHSAAQWLLTRSQSLARLLTPARVAILGAPNVGKSTLANALLGRPISITSDQAGTTRDWVDAQTIFTAPPAIPSSSPIAAPILLVDTAGIRDTGDPLEQQSITRTHQQAAQADVILLVFDATRTLAPEEQALLPLFADRPTVIACNKIDALDPRSPPPDLPGSLPISAKNRIGLEALMSAVLAQLELAAVDVHEPFAFTERQRHLLQSLTLAADVDTCVEIVRRIAGDPQ